MSTMSLQEPSSRNLATLTQSPSQPSVASGSNKAELGSALAVVVSLSSAATAQLASANKDFATVAKKARAALDAEYKLLGGDPTKGTADDQISLIFKATQNLDFDRRTLYAIKSNEGGQFDAWEQSIAGSLMTRQHGVALGMDTIEFRMGKLDHLTINKKSIEFLDSVSAEEKTSLDWAVQRAVSQSNYEALARSRGKEPENLESKNQLVEMILAALRRLAALGDPSNQLEDMPEYKQAEKFFASGQSKLAV